ncbi:hypothetical protein D3C75_1305870 [compost metagenome]
MAMLQPAHGGGVGVGQAQAVEGFMPVPQALGVQDLAWGSLQQPDARGTGIACQLCQKCQAAAVR